MSRKRVQPQRQNQLQPHKDDEARSQASSSRGVIREAFLYSAPIPPPQIVAGWEQVLPGSADRILALTENQSNHRQALENTVIASNIRNERIGQYLAFVFCMFVVACGTLLIYLGQGIMGLVALCSAIVAPAGLFVFAKLQGKRELKDKKDKTTKAIEKMSKSE